MQLAVLMPAYNEDEALTRTLEAIRARAEQAGGVAVFLVDDGSEAPIDPRALPAPTRSFTIVLARHVVNLGQGAALETARQLALQRGGYAAYVTMDADGQHRFEDALTLADAVRAGADVAFGNRFLGESNVPPVRRVVLALARVFDRVVTGLRLGDAHNGLRALSQRALERVPLRQNGMAHATEIKRRVSRAGALRVVELPVSVRYTPRTLAKGQSSLGAMVILRDLLQRYLFEVSE